MKAKLLKQIQPSAPKLHACVNCPANSVCCSVSSKGGVVEAPYLLPSDISAISEQTGLDATGFVEDRVNTFTGNLVSFVSPPTDGRGCRFHDAANGRCGIYDARPIDCRLYPLDIMLIGDSYHWIVWKYCEITREDLDELLTYGRSMLPLIKEHIHDYATVPLEIMDKSPYLVIAPLEYPMD